MPPLEDLSKKEYMKALIIENLQIDYCPGGAMEIADGDSIIPIINELMPQYPLVIAAVDWHPANHVSFAANHPWRRFGQVIEIEGLQQELFPIHCVNNTFGAAFYPSLAKEHIQHIIYKGTSVTIDNYSCFYDADRKKVNNLVNILQAAAVEEINFVGLDFNKSIQKSALDAITLGYKVSIIRTACKGNLPHAFETSLKELQKSGITLL